MLTRSRLATPYLRRFTALVASRLSIGVLVASGMGSPPLLADGWHNAALATKSLDDWLSELKRAIPDLDKRLQEHGLRASNDIEALKRRVEVGKKRAPGPTAGGKIHAEFTPEQLALLERKAADCMEVLAYMKPENIYPREFPDFQLQKIPEYRKTATALLQMMGLPGGKAVANTLTSALRGGLPNGGDVTFHPSFIPEILSLFEKQAAAGNLSPEDLQSLGDASAGKKPPPYDQLARRVMEIIDKNSDLPSLLKWAEATDDPNRKQKIINSIKTRLASANGTELSAVLASSAATPDLRKAVVAQLKQRLGETSVLQLLVQLNAKIDNDLVAAVRRELDTRSVKFADVEGDLPQIRKFLDSQDPAVSLAAKAQLENAFQRAPVTQCLEWLGPNDKPMRELIWTQIDGRIARADGARRESYRNAALTVLGDNEFKLPIRLAAVELLRRLNDRQAIVPVVALLPKLPRDLMSPAGALLKDISGQDFGPKPGDGVAQLNTCFKNWQRWCQEEGLSPKK